MLSKFVQDRFIFCSSLVLAGHSASINTISINADGSMLLSGGDSIKLCVFAINTHFQATTRVLSFGNWRMELFFRRFVAHSTELARRRRGLKRLTS